MFNLASLVITIAAETNQFQRSMDRIHGQLTRADVAASQFAGNLAVTFARAAVAMAGGLFDSTIMSAASLAESVNKVNVVFGDSAGAMISYADEMADTFALPKRDLLDATLVMGMMAKNTGMAKGEAAQFGVEMSKVAIDAASLFEGGTDEALKKIQSGLQGQSRPLREYGVFLTAARVQQEAFNMGLGRTKAELSEGDKIMARASLITKDLADAQGDMGRTFGDTRNQMRAFWGILSNLGQDIGTTVMPAFNAILGGLVGMARGMSGFFRDNRAMFGEWVTVVMSSFAAAREFAQDYISAFRFVGARIADVLSPIPGLIREWLVEPLDALTGGALSALPGWFQSAFSSGIEWIGALRVEIRNFPQTWEIATLTIGGYWLDLTATIKSSMATIGAFLLESMASVAGGLLQVSAQIGGYMLMPGEYLVAGMTRAIEAVGSLWDAFIGKLAAVIDFVVRPLRDAANAISGETMSMEDDIGRLKGIFDAPAAGGKAMSDILGGLRNDLAATGAAGAVGLGALAKGSADGMRAWGDAAKTAAADAKASLNERIAAAAGVMADKESARGGGPKTELQLLAESAERSYRKGGGGSRGDGGEDEETGKQKKAEITGAAEFATKLRLGQDATDVPKKQLTELQQIREIEQKNSEVLARALDHQFAILG